MVLHGAKMIEDVERSQLLQGLTGRIKVFEEQSNLFGIELDRSFRASLYAVVPEVVFEYIA